MAYMSGKLNSEDKIFWFGVITGWIGKWIKAICNHQQQRGLLC